MDLIFTKIISTKDYVSFNVYQYLDLTTVQIHFNLKECNSKNVVHDMSQVSDMA